MILNVASSSFQRERSRWVFEKQNHLRIRIRSGDCSFIAARRGLRIREVPVRWSQFGWNESQLPARRLPNSRTLPVFAGTELPESIDSHDVTHPLRVVRVPTPTEIKIAVVFTIAQHSGDLWPTLYGMQKRTAVTTQKSEKVSATLANLLEEVVGGMEARKYRKSAKLFSQGAEADAIYFIQTGKIKVMVLSAQGKEAVLAIMGPRDFLGESCLVGALHRTSTAICLEASAVFRIEKRDMLERASYPVRVLRDFCRFATGAQCQSRRRSLRSAVQSQRETAGARASEAFACRQTR